MVQVTQPRKANGRARFGQFALAAFVVGGLAACGSTSPGSGATATTNAAAGSPGTSAAANNTGTTMASGATSVVVSTTQNANFGTILVSGKTLYTLQPSSTPCTATCLQTWPELVLPSGVSAATAGSGVKASSLGTVNRGNGVLQVTYAGKPLYLFSQDTAAGQVNGNITDTWGKWSVATTGSAPASSGSKTNSTSTTAAAPGSGGAGF